MNTYISAFIILLLVFSITIAVTRTQPAAISLNSNSQKAGSFSFFSNFAGFNPFGASAAYSAGSSHPTGNPKDNYQCYYESCGFNMFGFNFGSFGSNNNGNSGSQNSSGANSGSSYGSGQNGNSASYGNPGSYNPLTQVQFGWFSGNNLNAGSRPSSEIAGANTDNNIAPNSFVLTGPQQNQDFILKEATFTFGGYLEGYSEPLKFETRIVGSGNELENWRYTSEKKVTYTLNIAGMRNLTFEVRARTSDGRVDLSPAQWPFRLVHSPLWGNVTIGGIGSNTNPNYESVSINNQTNRGINITGWRLADSTSVATIGQGVEILQPIPSYNANNNIILPPSSYANINTGASPIGFSYRENSCSYFLGSGKLAGNTDYENCYFQKRLDDNFLSNSWKIYLGLGNSLWDAHSTFYLMDTSGGVVDVRVY